MTGIEFENWAWLLIVPLWLAVARIGKRRSLVRAHRLATVCLVALALAGPSIRRQSSSIDLWVLIDRSDSASPEADSHRSEWEALVRKGRRPEDRLFFVDFADDALIRREGEDTPYTGSTKRTRLARALTLVLGHAESSRPQRVLVISDGLSTEPLGALASPLRARGIPVDHRLFSTPLSEDPEVRFLRAAPRSRPREPVTLQLGLSGPEGASYTARILRNDHEVGTTSGVFSKDRPFLSFGDRLSMPGTYRYSVELESERDAIRQNNRGETLVSVEGGAGVLLLSPYGDDPLISVLRSTGLAVRHVRSGSTLTERDLTGIRTVIFNNVAASEVSSSFLGALPFFVEQQGRGLLMIGGADSFGSGGYFGSALDPLLPVSMELREEQVKVAAALAIVLDRSGSMSVTADGGLTKMQLASDGAASAIELLGNKDAVAVFAVDSSPHPVVPMTVINGRQDNLAHLVRSIESGGGGIFVYSGLRAAADEMRTAKGGKKHVILFADAADAEEPGTYVELLGEMQAKQITVSVIALGTESDADAEFLKDVALRGGGKIFFSDRPRELRALFTQETVRVARALFVDQAAPLIPEAGWRSIASRDLTWPAQVDGYNLTFMRDRATVIATTDERAPLAAIWNRGIGRTGVVTFPAAGKFSEAVRNWKGYADFFQTTVRWLTGGEVPPGVFLRQTIDGDDLRLELLYDESWEERVQRSAPRILIDADPPREHVWERLEPGRFSATVPIPTDGSLRGVIQIGEHTLQVGPLLNPNNPEWTYDRERIEELRELSRSTGGVERIDLSRSWEAPPKVQPSPLRIPLVAVILILILADAAWVKFLKRGE